MGDSRMMAKSGLKRNRTPSLAPSRVRDLNLEPYRKIGQGLAVTCPDLHEPDEYRQVSIYATSRKLSAS